MPKTWAGPDKKTKRKGTQTKQGTAATVVFNEVRRTGYPCTPSKRGTQ